MNLIFIYFKLKKLKEYIVKYNNGIIINQVNVAYSYKKKIKHKNIETNLLI